ncbi:hypothetical protein Poli38472_013056 [Pythium oligandrum]|uniref:Glycosyltransferase 2-like domain-containing protein n=1 Tax=Pythium oligandrum TaxID=41045 RepID=A0A8K1CIY7_PYTOL|nr:hypothetical protein Poli38472_013056 [Pythium oligandrum]|eukprot:TMW64434.1 hypothetical protein Poli38472_013056 [Pythium oligandrum]
MTSPRVHIISFSMDRVFQLSEYLRTLHAYVTLDGQRISEEPQWARITIICRCSTPAIRTYYEQVAAEYPNVAFLYEDEATTRDFAECLLECLGLEDTSIEQATQEATSSASASTPCPYVLLNVDDAFFFDDIDLAKAIQFLDATDGTEPVMKTCTTSGESTAESLPLWNFAFHLKLAPSIWRSHMSNQPMLPLPPMATVLPPGLDAVSMALSAEESDRLFLTFDPARGVLDWSYPWELSGSVYRYDTIARVISAIQTQFGRQGISRPNHLELRGHQIVHGQWMNQTHRLRCACLPRPKMHVFAINQVQDIYDNRLYTTERRSMDDPRGSNEFLGSSAGDLGHLLRLYETQETLDESYYRRHRFSSVHIGTLVLASAANQARVRGSVDWTADHMPLVSVVMPVFNMGRYVEQALRSVMQQSYSQMEIIVIDDASSDETSKILTRLVGQDPRIKYVRNESNKGIAASLNRGFTVAQGTFVARMDADDVAFPDRIQRQIHFMLEHPHVDILGTSILVGHEGDSECESELTNGVKTQEKATSIVMETAVYPTSSLATKWQLLFGCFLAHPTVMMHRRVLNTIVASNSELYSTKTPSCEDYDLWLRCAYRHNLTIMSLGDVLLYHRKHEKQISAMHRLQQLQQTQTTAMTWFQLLTNSEDTASSIKAIKPLLEPEAEFTVEEFARAIDMLEQLQSRLMTPESPTPPAPSLSPVMNGNGNAARPSMEDMVLCRGSVSSPVASRVTQEDTLRNDEWEAETRYVQGDAASRHGEMAFKAMLVDSTEGARLWSAYAAKYPEVSRAAFSKLMKKPAAAKKQ